MPDIDFIRQDIARMRQQIGRQRREILQLQRAGIASTSAETLLERMLNKTDALCDERDRLKAIQPAPTRARVLGGRKW